MIQVLCQLQQRVNADDFAPLERDLKDWQGAKYLDHFIDVPGLIGFPMLEKWVLDGRGQDSIYIKAVHTEAEKAHVGKGTLCLLNRELVGIEHQPHRCLFAVGEHDTQVCDLVKDTLDLCLHDGLAQGQLERSGDRGQ